jgi:alkaline phosphatase
MISRKAQVSWSTHGHSGVDVNIYGTADTNHRLHGNRENTQVGDFLRDYLDVDVRAVTHELVKKGVDHVNAKGQGINWMGRGLAERGVDGVRGEG